MGCLLSLHACTWGLMQAPSPSSPPTTDEMHLIIALFAPLDSPDFFGLPSTLSPSRTSITTSACFTLPTSSCLAACNCYQLLFDRPLAARRATAHSPSTDCHHSPTAHAFSSIKTRLIRPSARRASSQPALAALQTESSPVFCLLTLDFLSPAAF